ncbi:MAG: 2-dehydropantoate 2-reductase [Alphaproteobacteria bacterium]
MKVCIFGAGSVSGMAGARMARAGIDVTLVARGAHLRAIQANGLTIRDQEGGFTVRPPATDDTGALGVQDVVILGVKAHTIAPALPQILPLIGPQTTVVPAINGIPWWYFHALPGPHAGRSLNSVDCGGRIMAAIDPARLLGCVVYVATTIPEPGVIEHGSGGRYVLGEPDGSDSARRHAVSSLFAAAGLTAPLSPDIRTEVWNKLWGNLSGNPLSILTGAHCSGLVDDPDVADVMGRMMREAKGVADAMGTRVDLDVSARLAGFYQVGPFQTSMQQDMAAGRPIELDPILGSVIELAGLFDVPVPLLQTVYSMARQKAELAGCYRPPGG